MLLVLAAASFCLFLGLAMAIIQARDPADIAPSGINGESMPG